MMPAHQPQPRVETVFGNEDSPNAPTVRCALERVAALEHHTPSRHMPFAVVALDVAPRNARSTTYERHYRLMYALRCRDRPTRYFFYDPLAQSKANAPRTTTYPALNTGEDEPWIIRRIHSYETDQIG